MRQEYKSKCAQKNIEYYNDFFSSRKKEILKGLTSKPKYLDPILGYHPKIREFYDSLCHEQDYYITKVERDLIIRDRKSIINISSPTDIVDLGCGRMEKTQIILSEAVEKNEISIHACDLDFDLINSSMEHLEYFFGQFVKTEIYVEDFESCIGQLKYKYGKKLFMLLGQTFGNFTNIEKNIFTSTLCDSMKHSDFFMVGLDLVKDPKIIERAWNDAAGCQANSVLSMIDLINEQYNGNLETKNFSHVAKYEKSRRSLVSYAVSQKEQYAKIKELDIDVYFNEGEKIEVEFSERFLLTEVIEYFQSFGMRTIKVSVHDEIPYALLLFSGPKDNAPAAE